MKKVITLTYLCLLAHLAPAADWPTYRHDIARSGITKEELLPPLKGNWQFQPQHAPRCAWGEPNPRAVGGWFHQTEGRRVQFDDTFHVAAAGNLIIFGSSADGCLYALNATTGNIQWSFISGGPIRLAPTIEGDRVYFGSDDGFAYCLKISDGTEFWRYQAAPADNQLLGSGQMISRWPIRSSVLVDKGVAYFGAGVFPAEGVFIHAVDAQTGYRLWCNDERGAPPRSRFSPQGYLLASEKALYVPTGRVSPAGLSRKDGKLLYETYFEHAIGGTYALLVGDNIFTGTNEIMGYNKETRTRFAWFQAKQLIVTDSHYYLLDGVKMSAINRKDYPVASLHRETLRDRMNREHRDSVKAIKSVEGARRAVEKSRKTLTEIKSGKKKGDQEKIEKQLTADEKNLKEALTHEDYTKRKKLLEDIKTADDAIAATTKWRVPTECAESLIMSGKILYAGGNGKVTAVNSEDGEKLWEVKVVGKARGLAVANGRLIVSTDTGAIYCFSKSGPKSPVLVKQSVDPDPFPKDQLTAVIDDAVTRILDASPATNGYALVLGSGSGRMAFELAKRTDLIIYGVETDSEKVKESRRKLQSAGLLGTRIRIDPVEIGSHKPLPYSDYFANLVVSERALTDGAFPGSAADVFRMTRPIDGMICIGAPSAASRKPGKKTVPSLRKWAAQSKEFQKAVVTDTDDGVWLTFKRGIIPGAGSWTQEYGNPGNTTCGDDTHLTCPLGVLWYGDPGPGQMAGRHTRASAPLSANGRMFIQGEGKGSVVGRGKNVVMCYDAYNGLKLWERSIDGALRTVMSHDGANAVLNNDSYFIVTSDGCMRLAAATGETQTTYRLPDNKDKSSRWGYISVVGNRLYGTRTDSRRTGNAIFCFDVPTGDLVWKCEAEKIPQGAISIGDGKLFFARADVTSKQRLDALSELRGAAEKLTGKAREKADEAIKNADVRLVTALNAENGKTLWTHPMELTGAISHAYWCSLGSIYKDGVLVLFGVYADGHYWKQFFAGKFNSRRIFALDALNGKSLWKQNIGYRVRPIIVGDTLHSEPWAFDLRTGKQRMRVHPITGREDPWQFARPGHHCGCPAASENLLLFRSSTLGWYDLAGDFGTQHFGGLRTSCWINFIPANGVLMVPEGGSGCMCAFPTSCTVVFKNREDNRSWGCFSAPGDLTPVKHLAINLGAPGDRRAPDGTMWFGYPRPRGSLVMNFDINAKFYSAGRYFCHDPLMLKIEGASPPWVARSGMRGAKQLTLPLIKQGEGAARYTVRLTFTDVDNGTIGQRVFSIKLQGKEVAAGVDVVKDAGGSAKTIVKEFKGIHVEENLNIELTSKVLKPSTEQMPVLQGVEVVRERVLSAGVLLPQIELSDPQPEQQGVIKMSNHTDKDLKGILHIKAPDGFLLTPAEHPVILAQGQSCELPVTAKVVKKGEGKITTATFSLISNNGKEEWKGESSIDYLGPLGRILLKVDKDAWVIKKLSDKNNSTDVQLNIDGGNSKAGDEAHAVAYLTFKPVFEGKFIRSYLRLYNAGNPTGNSGEIRLVGSDWSEKTLKYDNKPEPGRVLAKIGSVIENQVVKLDLLLTEEELKEAGKNLNLAIVPTSNDGVNYMSKEGKNPAELIIEYMPGK
ncbi:MAG: PQQ-binding-like beta-propeller repeat protein [Kiritimatiellae bacterium]|jgi:outer membrane protein assembly factor BamB|nr:PQQ-binding-like beta-propeller repeat protein [Kiritimatiellia bacterium]